MTRFSRCFDAHCGISTSYEIYGKFLCSLTFNAGEGIWTLEPLQEQVLSLPPLTAWLPLLSTSLMGFEPMAFCLGGKHSNPLSYRPSSISAGSPHKRNKYASNSRHSTSTLYLICIIISTYGCSFTVWPDSSIQVSYKAKFHCSNTYAKTHRTFYEVFDSL